MTACDPGKQRGDLPPHRKHSELTSTDKHTHRKAQGQGYAYTELKRTYELA